MFIILKPCLVRPRNPIGAKLKPHATQEFTCMERKYTYLSAQLAIALAEPLHMKG